MAKARILFFDIESGLHADFTPLVTFGYAWNEGKAQTIVPSEYRSYDVFLKAVYDLLASADVWVTYFGKGFDIKMLNSYFLEAGVKPLPPVQHVDMYWTVKNNMLLHSHRMESVAEFLECPHKKTAIKPRTWRLAFAGDKEAIEYIRDHCYRDVKILAWIYYNKLRPFVRLHPQVGELGACKVCGSEALQRRGFSITISGPKKQRVQCSSCGAWSLQKLEDDE